jgi:predicted nucleic acid-binding protein
VIVLDASALIAHLDRSDAHHERARQILLDNAHERLAASVLTLAETLVAPARANRLAHAQTALAELAIEPIALAHDAAHDLATLRAQTALRIPDCCVLYAATVARADSLAAFDDRLARAAEARGFTVL